MRINTTLIGAIACGLTLTACVQPGPYNPNDPNQRTRNGALLGAAAGGALGALTGDDNDKTSDRVLGGALIGGALGAMTGTILDQQAADLDQSIQNSRIQIINDGNQLRVVMPEGILFAVDSASVNGSIIGDLQAVANNLNRYPNSYVQVIGHTDNTGSAAYNQQLSERRAQAVANILRSSGVSATRLAAIGRGENQPVASNLNETGRAQNRRVEIVIIPTQ